MIETCERNAVRLAVNHQMRFMEQYTIPKGLIQSGDYGELSSISVIAGNFGMAMNGTHYFEMLRYITDDVPSEVVAWFSPEDIPNPRGPQFVDKAGSVRVTTRRGKRFYMDISADQGHGMLAVYAARNGRIVVDELTGEMKTAVRKPEHRDLPTTRYGMPFVESTQKISPADVIAPSMAVLQALLNNENFPSGADGRKAVEVLVAAYISAESGNRVVRLDRDLLPCQRSFPWA
jgi:predicted dehydrogenase